MAESRAVVKARAGGGPVGRTNRAAHARHGFSGGSRREVVFDWRGCGLGGRIVGASMVWDLWKCGARHADVANACAARAALVHPDPPPHSHHLDPRRAVHPHHHLDTEPAESSILAPPPPSPESASLAWIGCSVAPHTHTRIRITARTRVSGHPHGTRTAPGSRRYRGAQPPPLARRRRGHDRAVWYMVRASMSRGAGLLQSRTRSGSSGREEGETRKRMRLIRGSGRLLHALDETGDAEPHLPQAVQWSTSGRARRIGRPRCTRAYTRLPHPRARAQHPPPPSSKREGMGINGARAQQGPAPRSRGPRRSSVVPTKNTATQQRLPRPRDAGTRVVHAHTKAGWHRQILRLDARCEKPDAGRILSRGFGVVEGGASVPSLVDGADDAGRLCTGLFKECASGRDREWSCKEERESGLESKQVNGWRRVPVSASHVPLQIAESQVARRDPWAGGRHRRLQGDAWRVIANAERTRNAWKWELGSLQQFH
ncbi:hypothetical protein K438DRAFT_1782407 [Mycena galopus ATCC 62051]|nr:hypothetical protein K438DRAFT_1782407 [Mycena galopus ATCC 62051]